MAVAEVTERGRELLGGYVRDVWGATQGAPEVEQVLVYLLLDQEGYMIEPAARVGGQWVRFQKLDEHLARPIGSDATADTLSEQWDEGLFGEDFDDLTAGRPRATRVVVTATSPSGEPSVDSTDEEFWKGEESSFQLLREWWDRLVATGDARAAW